MRYVLHSTVLKRGMAMILGGAFLLGLSACGRPGAPKPPGPSEKVTYPQIYPPE